MLSSASFSLNNFAICKYCYKEQRSSFGEHDNSESMWKLSKWDKKMESEQGDKNTDKAAQKLKENKRQSNQILSLPVSFNKANISVRVKCLGSWSLDSALSPIAYKECVQLQKSSNILVVECTDA